jgi:hypothetical protein
MNIHESSINFGNLIKDLAEMYPYDVEEVVLIELIANALDAKATRIKIDFDKGQGTLSILDNGYGMTASQFDEYHDFAAGLKTRGTGIGFAGLGAKISFNVAERVITKTKSKTFNGGSDWYLQSGKRLVWEEIDASDMQNYGTKVEVHFMKDVGLSYESSANIINLIRRHYLPLFDIKLLELYELLNFYSNDLRFLVNGKEINPTRIREDFDLERFKEFSPSSSEKTLGYGLFGISLSEYPLGENICGVLLCTHGKVIKSELFNQFPGEYGPRIFGIVEVPEFINYLTTSKTDFIRKGRNREFEKIFGPIRNEFKEWLKELGVEPVEISDTQEAYKLVNELKKLLHDVPELGDFFGFRSKKSILIAGKEGDTNAVEVEGTEPTIPAGNIGPKGTSPGPKDVGAEEGQALLEDEDGDKKARPISRIGKVGPKISFVNANDRVELSWIDGNNITINSAHPSYIKTESNTSARRLQNLFAIATAVQRYILSDVAFNIDLMFIDRMMSAWGRKSITKS